MHIFMASDIIERFGVTNDTNTVHDIDFADKEARRSLTNLKLIANEETNLNNTTSSTKTKEDNENIIQHVSNKTNLNPLSEQMCRREKTLQIAFIVTRGSNHCQECSSENIEILEHKI